MGQAAIVPLLYFTAGVTAVAAIQQGRAAAEAERFRQAESERRMAQERVSSLDRMNERRRELALALGEQEAMGAQAGFDPFSAGSSFLAIREETQRVAKKDIEMMRLVDANQIASGRLEISQSKVAASAAKTQGYLKAASAVSGAGFEHSRL